MLLFLYGLFVVAAGARSAVQLSGHAARAPVAYTLSAAAAVVYAIGFVLVWRAERGSGRRAAIGFAVLELAGVLVVGTVSVLEPSTLGGASVWSYYGAGYVFVPLLLPVGVFVWLAPSRFRGGSVKME